AAQVRARSVQALALPPRPGREAGHHGALAGNRTQPHDLRRNGASRPPLCQNPLNLDRYQDPARNTGRGVVGQRGLLMNIPDFPVSAPASVALPIHDRLAGELNERPADVLRVGVVGYGYWGPKVVRTLHSL